MRHFTDLRGYVEALDELGDVMRITREVDADIESAAITRRSYELRSHGPLFENIQRRAARIKLRLCAPSAPDDRGSPFAVEGRHLRGVVAVTGGGVLGYRGLDRCELLGAQFNVERAQRFGQSLAPAGPDQRDDVVALGVHPGDRDLRDGHAEFGCHAAQPLDEGEVAVEVLAAEAWAVCPEVA
ncbi:MAG: UbiD family decarboxylase [Mycobacterium sp.]|nr:UbiD family decarboxylase [Mycobacterium sp.]